MLTKRTQILFQPQTWNLLKKISAESNISVGEAVRKAVKNQYQKKITKNKALSAHQTILKNRVKFKKIDYKALIEHGRKY